MWTQMLPALRMTLLMTAITGFVYPGLVTTLCQILFPHQANGSLVTHKGAVIGSSLIGQSFTEDRYFHGRPSAAGADGYDAAASGGSNLGPTSQKLVDRVKDASTKLRAAQPDVGPIPADLLTTSASGLDPHISPASAQLQVARVAKARKVDASSVAALVQQFTEGRDLGLLGEPRVNVLLVNLALDRQYPNN